MPSLSISAAMQKVGVGHETEGDPYKSVSWPMSAGLDHVDPPQVRATLAVLSRATPTTAQNVVLGHESQVSSATEPIWEADHAWPFQVAAESSPAAIQNEEVGHETRDRPPPAC